MRNVRESPGAGPLAARPPSNRQALEGGRMARRPLREWPLPPVRGIVAPMIGCNPGGRRPALPTRSWKPPAWPGEEGDYTSATGDLILENVEFKTMHGGGKKVTLESMEIMGAQVGWFAG